jgi:hypothetical protein
VIPAEARLPHDDFDQRPRLTADELRRRLSHTDQDTHPLQCERLARALALLEVSDDYARRASALLEDVPA